MDDDIAARIVALIAGVPIHPDSLLGRLLAADNAAAVRYHVAHIAGDHAGDPRPEGCDDCAAAE